MRPDIEDWLDRRAGLQLEKREGLEPPSDLSRRDALELHYWVYLQDFPITVYIGSAIVITAGAHVLFRLAKWLFI